MHHRRGAMQYRQAMCRIPKSKVKYVDLYSASSWSTTSNALPFPVSRRWSPQANPTARHQRTLQDHVIRVGAPRDMPVYFPTFAGTKLYCLVTEGVNNLPKAVAQQRRGRASNPRLLYRKSDALPLSHRATPTGMSLSLRDYTVHPLKQNFNIQGAA